MTILIYELPMNIIFIIFVDSPLYMLAQDGRDLEI